MFDFLKRDQMKKDKIITKTIKLKIDQHEPNKQQRVNSDAPEWKAPQFLLWILNPHCYLIVQELVYLTY